MWALSMPMRNTGRSVTMGVPSWESTSPRVAGVVARSRVEFAAASGCTRAGDHRVTHSPSTSSSAAVVPTVHGSSPPRSQDQVSGTVVAPSSTSAGSPAVTVRGSPARFPSRVASAASGSGGASVNSATSRVPSVRSAARTAASSAGSGGVEHPAAKGRTRAGRSTTRATAVQLPRPGLRPGRTGRPDDEFPACPREAALDGGPAALDGGPAASSSGITLCSPSTGSTATLGPRAHPVRSHDGGPSPGAARDLATVTAARSRADGQGSAPRHQDASSPQCPWRGCVQGAPGTDAPKPTPRSRHHAPSRPRALGHRPAGNAP